MQQQSQSFLASQFIRQPLSYSKDSCKVRIVLNFYLPHFNQSSSESLKTIVIVLKCLWNHSQQGLLELIVCHKLLIEAYKPINIQLVSKSESSDLVKYLAIVGALGLSYFAINYLSAAKPNFKPIPIEKTRRIIQQIKYQLYANCISFAEGVNGKLKGKYPENDLQIYLRGEMTKLYEAKEELITNKYGVSKDEYGNALAAYKNDKQIDKSTKEIFDMMDRALKGELPDLTVPAPALALLKEAQTIQLYREMCEIIAIRVWEKLDECRKNDPYFNPKDDSHFKKAIRELSIYDLKVDFLAGKGYREEWGCPNEVFFKVMETVKQRSAECKTQANAVEKAYEKAIEKISHEPQTMNPDEIKELFVKEIRNFLKPAAPVQAPPAVVQAPKPAQPLFNASANNRKPAPPKPKQEDEDFDMEKLMMEELMKRSQESPKEKPVNLTVSAPIAVSHMKVQEKPAPVEVDLKAIPEESKAVEPELVEPKLDEPKVEEVKVEEQKVEQVHVENDKLEQFKPEEQKVEEQKVEEINVEISQVEAAQFEQPIIAEPVVSSPIVEQQVSEAIVEQRKVEEPLQAEPKEVEKVQQQVNKLPQAEQQIQERQPSAQPDNENNAVPKLQTSPQVEEEIVAAPGN